MHRGPWGRAGGDAEKDNQLSEEEARRALKAAFQRRPADFGRSLLQGGSAVHWATAAPLQGGRATPS